ncbi:penicillin-binding transpeptidase domain-containing protein [Melghirimyces algeriensis]|uniref:Penicillin-binding protein 2B n=1 Tax=Melghirimyces algeriensis TaxID=910412 RepID=A0A521BLZ6_9BACL|nr:PASTA domain-containing penicillin-binding protein [Melghirimyces algeriensis]SMO48136.1 penicillin-binding protein 2B [Melghirimyces algeriensis]
MNPATKASKWRSLLVGLLCTLFLSALIFRLLWIQTIDAKNLRERAEKTWEAKTVIEPVRGSIMDRSGTFTLAESVEKYIIAADLDQVDDPRETAEKLAPLLDIPEQKLLKKLTKKTAKQVELKKKGNFKVSRKVRDEVLKLDLNGIYSIKTPGRQFVEGKLAAHVLGFVNVAGKAVGGVEQTYDNELRGHEGKIRFKKDARGDQIPQSAQDYQPPENGKDLLLTLDANIQYSVEKILDEAMVEHHAKGATAIVADPNTGEILAMASRPTFDPARFDKTWKQGENDVNRAVQAQYEPGSTFKIITLAAAIEENVFHSDERFQSGSIQVDNQIIRDWNDRGWGEISYADGVYLSSNVAFVRLSEKLGANRLIRYIDRFGFGKITERSGRSTGIDLPAEARGLFFGHSPLHPTELATTSFGQGIAVTPIQQVMAVSAVANGGTLYRPYVMKEIRDPKNKKVLKKNKPYPVRKNVISKETAGQVRTLLRGVVTEGTGKQADVEGYRVAGKTGTALKPKKDGKGYETGKYVASFIGFAPADDPELVVYVAIDEPGKSGDGGTVAAPAAGRIIASSLHHMGVSKSEPAQQAKTQQDRPVAKEWVDQPVDEVKKEILETGIQAKVLGSGRRVLRQYPRPGEPLITGATYLLTESPPALEMPDLTGASLRQALTICRLMDLQPQINGEGYVTQQSISPGDRVMERKKIRLKLKPNHG